MKCNAQKGQVELNNMYIPNAPGFVLLDKSPSLVEKPSDPKAFGIDILNLLEGGAIQVTPYWLFQHPNYTFENHTNNKFPILQTFNISVASIVKDTFSSIAAGGRVTVLRLFSQNRVAQINSIKSNIVDLLVAEDMKETQIKEKLKEIEYLRSRASFLLEFAGAISSTVGNNGVEALHINKTGLWLNIRWAPYYKIPIDLVGVVRYTKGSLFTSQDVPFFDYGIAMSYNTRVLDMSMEYVARHDFSLKGSNYNRFALVSNYMISEKIVIVASIGKDFYSVKNIIGVLGVKFGFSNQKMSLLN
ncbi:MAG: hypothetical protein R2800_03675 [Flavipsychrobacter sp.]